MTVVVYGVSHDDRTNLVNLKVSFSSMDSEVRIQTFERFGLTIQSSQE